MAIESGTTDDPLADVPSEPSEDGLRVRKRRVKVRRKQDKLGQPLRMALMLGLPIALWLGIFFAGRALL